MAYQCDRCNHWTANKDKHECINDLYEKLKEENKRLREALELIAGPSEFNCAVGEGNLRAAAQAALKQTESKDS